MRHQLAIFDLDGTLFDTRYVNFMAYNDALSGYGKQIAYDYFARHCNGKHYQTFLPAFVETKDQMETVHALKKRAYPQYLEHAVPNRHLFTLLECMRPAYYAAVVTTASRSNTEEILARYQKSACFDLVITQEDVIQKKPHPEGFLQAMRHFAVSSQDTVIFEDSDVGLEAAYQTGATVFAVKGYA